MSINQVKGVLLEEVLLWLLNRSGYRTVDKVGEEDETLEELSGGLGVKGRGEVHQIDAVADVMVTLPFSYPHRLLLEAKWSDKNKVGLGVVRNAVGVHKDVNEFWVPQKDNVPASRRYHYTYAVFSSFGYTEPAQKYAFAQDVFLIELPRTGPLSGVIQSIREVNDEVVVQLMGEDDETIRESKWLNRLRTNVRTELRSKAHHERTISKQIGPVRSVITACHEVRFGLMGTFNGRLPVFLVPEPDVELPTLVRDLGLGPMEIWWEGESWYIRSYGRNLFSFALPNELFTMYETAGVLTESAALDAKSNHMGVLQAVALVEKMPVLLQFTLNRDWHRQMKAQIDARAPEVQ